MYMTTETAAATQTVEISVTGKRREKKVVEMPEFFAFMRRMIRATSRRVADRDIEALTGMVMLRSELDAEIQKTVDQLRTVEGGDYSWTDIGRVLGITRQAAQQRYGK